MRGLLGAATWGDEPLPSIARGVAAGPHRWADPPWQLDRSDIVLAWSRTMEDGSPTPAPPHDPADHPWMASAGRLDAVAGSSPVGPGPELAARLLDPQAMPPAIAGDYALAAWDPEGRRLVLARDPLGQRPLYVYDEGRRVIFASDLAQLAALGVPLRIRDEPIRAFLAGAFPGPCQTVFHGVEQVPPGSVLEWGPGGRRLRRSWRWSLEPIRYRRDDDYVDHFLELLTRSVADRARGSTGAILMSSGLDSTSIAAAARAAGVALRAYTFESRRHPGVDESSLAREVAQALEMEIVTLDWDAHPPLAGFPAGGPDLDDPYVGAYQATLDHAYGRAADDGASALFAGDRGDLLFGDSVYGHLELLLEGRLATLFGDLAHERRRQETNWPDVLNRYLLRPLASSLRPGMRRPGASRPVPVPSWLRGTAVSDDTESCVGTYPARGPRAYGRRQRFHTIFTPMHTMGALWTDRHARAHGLSSVDPWSDARLVDFALRVPQAVLNRTRDRKRLARRALRRSLPDELVDRLGKVDPGPVFDTALTSHVEGIQALLAEPLSEAKGWVDGGELRGHYASFLAGAALDPRFWWALSVEWWLRHHHAESDSKGSS